MTSNYGTSLNPNILDKVNGNSRKMTKFNYFSGISTVTKNLGAPDSVNLKRLQFYNGKLAPMQDYLPEGQEYPEKYAKAVTLEDLLKAFKKGQISFVGPGGSGKTTLLKTITNGVLSQAYEGLEGIELVHFVDVRCIGEKEELTLNEYLFRGNEKKFTDEEKEEIVQFAINNPEKVLFVIDSLDTLPYSPANGNTQMEIHDRKDPATILRCLLSGSLLPNCRFITSSREYAIRNFDENLRALDVYGLAGLSTESMHKLAAEYLEEEEADEMMELLENNPILKSLCATPLFLVLTLIVRRNKPGYIPRSVTGILVHLLQLLIRTEFVDQKRKVLGKLENLSAKLTEEGRVAFTIADLSEFDISLHDVNDFSVPMPNGSHQRLILGDEVLYFAHKSLQEILTTFHIIKRCQQDYEDALQLSIHTSRYSVVRRLQCGTLLNNDVLEEAKNFFANLSKKEVETRRKFLRGSVIEQLVSKSTADTELGLLIAESGSGFDHINFSKITTVSGGYITLTAARGHALGLLLRRIKSLQQLDLSYCSPQAAGLENIHHVIHGADLQINSLRICAFGMPDMGPEKMSIIGQILKSCPTQVVEIGNAITVAEAVALATNLNDCVKTKLQNFSPVAVVIKQQLTQEEAVGLHKFVKIFVGDTGLSLNMKEKEASTSDAVLRFVGKRDDRMVEHLLLDIHEQRIKLVAQLLSFLKYFTPLEVTIRIYISLGSDQLDELGIVIKEHLVRDVTVYVQQDRQPTAEHWINFEKALDGFQMSSFQPRCFVNLGSREMSVIGSIIANHSEIDLSASIITIEGLEKLRDRISNVQLKRLALQLETNRGGRGYNVAGEIMVKGRVQSLDMSFYEKTESGRKTHNEVVMVSIRWNETGLIAERFELERIQSISNRALTSANLSAFLAGIKSVEMVHIVMKRIQLTARSISEIATLIPSCHVRKLELVACEITGIDYGPISAPVENVPDRTISFIGGYLNSDGVRAIVELAANCGACALEMQPDGLCDEHLHSLAGSLDSHEIHRLKLGGRTSFGVSNWSIRALIPILPNVNDEIDLIDRVPVEEERHLLRSELERLGLPGLTILFDGGRKKISLAELGSKRRNKDMVADVKDTAEKKPKLEPSQDAPGAPHSWASAVARGNQKGPMGPIAPEMTQPHMGQVSPSALGQQSPGSNKIQFVSPLPVQPNVKLSWTPSPNTHYAQQGMTQPMPSNMGSPRVVHPNSHMQAQLAMARAHQHQAQQPGVINSPPQQQSIPTHSPMQTPQHQQHPAMQSMPTQVAQRIAQPPSKTQTTVSQEPVKQADKTEDLKPSTKKSAETPQLQPISVKTRNDGQASIQELQEFRHNFKLSTDVNKDQTNVANKTQQRPPPNILQHQPPPASRPQPPYPNPATQQQIYQQQPQTQQHLSYPGTMVHPEHGAPMQYTMAQGPTQVPMNQGMVPKPHPQHNIVTHMPHPQQIPHSQMTQQIPMASPGIQHFAAVASPQTPILVSPRQMDSPKQMGGRMLQQVDKPTMPMQQPIMSPKAEIPNYNMNGNVHVVTGPPMAPTTPSAVISVSAAGPAPLVSSPYPSTISVNSQMGQQQMKQSPTPAQVASPSSTPSAEQSAGTPSTASITSPTAGKALNPEAIEFKPRTPAKPTVIATRAATPLQQQSYVAYQPQVIGGIGPQSSQLVTPVYNPDVTEFVSGMNMKKSTEEAYLKHLNSNDLFYRIDPGRDKGKVLIININDFENYPKKRRNGSEVDERNLFDLWKKLGFDVTTKRDLPAQEMRNCCRKFADDPEGVNVVVIVIMSHGGRYPSGEEYFVGADNEKVLQKDIINMFSSRESKQLRGIPKLFMFQACRGTEMDYEFDDETQHQDDDEAVIRAGRPERSDMLLAFPTQAGFKALRTRKKGSWLMNAVTNIFMHHAHDTHVLDLLTMVNKEVGSKVVKTEGGDRIQTSCQENYFQKRLLLFPGWPQK